MKKCLIGFSALLVILLGLTGCGKSANEAENLSAEVPEVMVPAEAEPVSAGPDRIIYDNSQAMYGLTATHQYNGVIHAFMQAEALRSPECYTLQAVDTKTEDNLQWAPLDYNVLKVSFTEKALYTFYRAGETIPKLGEDGPLGLLFGSDLIDPDRLTLVVTDLTENNFGGSEIAARLSEVLKEKEGTGITLYGLSCSGFEGNVSYPGYTADGTEIMTVLGYDGNAQVYLLAIGPIAELQAFDARFAEKLGGGAALDKATYWNSTAYEEESGLGDFTVLPARKLSGGRAETLNTTVNAILTEQSGDTFRFEYKKSTASKYRDRIQLALLADLDGNSPFADQPLQISGLTVEQREASQKEEHPFVPSAVETELTACALTGPLTTWKEGTEHDDGSILADGGYLIQLAVGQPEKKTEYRIAFDLVTDLAGDHSWTAQKSATVYEYQSLRDLLPSSPLNSRHLIWKAGAADILARTLDLADVDQLLAVSVPQAKTVRHVEIFLTR